MVTYKFNKPYYELHLSNFEEKIVNVVSFKGEEMISGLFEFKIDLVSKDPELDSSLILNNNATLILNRGDEDPVKIHGIISHFEQYGKSHDFIFYRAILVPRCWRLNLVYQNEVYLNADIEMIIEKLLEDIGLSSQDYKIELKESYPKKEYIVQYRETNLNFLCRWLEHYGIYFYFDHKGEKDVIVFTDSITKLPSLDLTENLGYNINKDPLSDKESVLEISCSEKIVTGSFQVKDYNYMFPEKQLMAQSQINSNHPGLYYDFGDNFEDENEAELIAKTRNEEFLTESKIFFGKSDCRLFSAGYKFSFEKHFRNDWNGEYIITSVTHYGNQPTLFAFVNTNYKQVTYENHFRAIPSSVEFKPKRRTAVPKIYGIMSAKIESGAGDEYAFIDDHGRYKAKMLFDLSDVSNGEASLPIRLTQSYSGSGYGIHFPNHADTELLWACVDGNVDRPVGLGTIPNPSQATPVASRNRTQNMIRTASGNEFIMDDKSKEAQIILKSSDMHKIILDDKDDKIEVTSKDMHKLTMDDKNKNIEVKSKEGHKILMDDENTKIEVVSKEGHFITINDKGGEEKIQISDKDKKNTFILDIKNNKLVIETKEGSIDILAEKGELNIKSKTLNIETESETSVKSGKYKIEVDQDFELKASNIKFDAQMDLKIKAGMNMSAEAGMEQEVKGLNTTVEAGVNMNVKGALATVEASGINTIKGSLVKIN
jgi:type VI secretion system secreted protein VgrG